MRFIIFLSILFVFTGNVFATSGDYICSSAEKVSSTVDIDTKTIVVSCNCNCTNEENRFYFIYSDKKKIIDMFEASRLVSFNGITSESFNQYKQENEVCSSSVFDNSFDSGLVFALKVPTGQNGETCFDIKSSKSLESITIDSRLLPLFSLIKGALYKPNEELKLNLDKLGLYQLANKNFSNNSEMIKVPTNSYLLGLKFDDKHEMKTVLVLDKERNYVIHVPSLNLVKENQEKYIKIKKKSYLYKQPNEKNKTQMYLIKGDKVTPLNEQIDDSGKQWYFINYKGTKELNMWIKAEAVDVSDIEKSDKSENSSQMEVQTQEIKNPVTDEKIATTVIPTIDVSNKSIPPTPNKTTKPNKTTGGSVPLSLFVPLLGLLAFRFS